MSEAPESEVVKPKTNVGNRYGRKGIPGVNWSTIKALWIAGKSTEELAATFNINPVTLQTRACREKWKALRQKVLDEQLANARNQTQNSSSDVKSYALTRFSGTENAAKAKTDEEVIKHAVAIAGADTFRSRVIAINEKALQVLEESPPQNVGEVDRFAEALTKVERIGARTYGYDREIERPVINIGVLTTGSEYDLEH